MRKEIAMKDNAEIRSIVGSLERRAEANEDVIAIKGTPIVFNQSADIGGWWEETIAPEAIDDDTLKDVRFLVNHNFKGIPLARSRNNTKNSTMRLVKDENGVNMEADLDPKNPTAAELNSAIERGDVSGMSFAFLVDGDKWDDLDSDYPKRTITHISEILEISAVTWPAYEQTSISSRSLESGKQSLADARKALESAKRKSEKIAELNLALERMKKNHE